MVMYYFYGPTPLYLQSIPLALENRYKRELERVLFPSPKDNLLKETTLVTYHESLPYPCYP